MNKNVKSIDAIIDSNITDLIKFLNREGIIKEDIIQILYNNKEEYIAIIYKQYDIWKRRI